MHPNPTPYIYFWFFGTLGDLFWVLFLFFESFEIVFWIRIPTFGGVCFIKLFDLRPPYMFLIFLNFRGSFCVWFLKILKLYFESEFPFLGGSVLWNFMIWGDYMFFLSVWGLFEFDFWFLKISKLYVESQFPILGGSVL